MKLTKKLQLQELIPEEIYKKHGARSVRFLNARLILAIQWLIDRHRLSRVIVNNWLWKGVRQESGLRIPGQKHYRGDGLHDAGNAFDVLVFKQEQTTHQLLKEIHQDALRNPKMYLEKGIWRMETLWLADSWLHIDACFAPDQDEVVFIDRSRRYGAKEYEQVLNSFLEHR